MPSFFNALLKYFKEKNQFRLILLKLPYFEIGNGFKK
jgi:hypothetical protein